MKNKVKEDMHVATKVSYDNFCSYFFQGSILFEPPRTLIGKDPFGTGLSALLDLMEIFLNNIAPGWFNGTHPTTIQDN